MRVPGLTTRTPKALAAKGCRIVHRRTGHSDTLAARFS